MDQVRASANLAFCTKVLNALMELSTLSPPCNSAAATSLSERADNAMTSTEMKSWLDRALNANKKVDALNMLVQQCRDRAQGLSRTLEADEKGKSDSTKNGTESALMQLIEIAEKAEIQRARAVCIIAETQNAIALLEDNDLETILTYRYLLSVKIDEIAELTNYAPRTIRKKQKEAIEKLCRLMPCNAATNVID